MNPRGRIVGFVKAIPRSDQHRPCTRRLATHDIQPPIAHHHRALRIEIHLTTGLFDQAGTWLAAAAYLPVPLNLRMRMVGTEVIRVNAGASGREALVERVMDFLEKRLVDDPAADPRLVGHDNRGEADAIE